MSVHWEKGRRALEAFSRAAVDASMTGPSPRNPYIDPSPDQMLRAGVALAFRRARCRWRRVRRRHDPVPPPPPVRGWPPTLPTRCVTGRSPRPPSSPLSTTTRSRCCSPGWTRRKMPCAWPTGDRGSIAPAAAPRQRRPVDTTGARGTRLADRAEGRYSRGGRCQRHSSSVAATLARLAPLRRHVSRRRTLTGHSATRGRLFVTGVSRSSTEIQHAKLPDVQHS